MLMGQRLYLLLFMTSFCLKFSSLWHWWPYQYAGHMSHMKLSSQKWPCNPRLSLKYSWMEHKPSVWVTWLVKIPLLTHNSFLFVSCLWHDNILLWCPKTTFLEFWPSKNCFFPNEMNQKLGKSKRSKKDWWCHVTSVIRSLLSLLLRFWSLL